MEDISPESDIDSTVTPIELSPFHNHGQMFDSDSFCMDELSPRFREQHYRHRNNKKKKGVHIEEDDANLSRREVNAIYKELQAISDKLKEENQILHGREAKVKERERMCVISQSNIETIVNQEVKQKWNLVVTQHNDDISKLEQTVKEKFKENKRLKDNFETLKQANDAVKKELESIQSLNEKLEKQLGSSQARLTNLLRKQDFDLRQREVDATATADGQSKTSKPKTEQEDKFKQSKASKSTAMPACDILTALLDWVCDAHLRHSVTDQPTRPSERYSAPDYVQEKIFRVLPNLVEVLKEVPMTTSKFCLPCLQFIYWSLLNVEQGHGQQKTSLSSTLRRLGEEVYRSRLTRAPDVDRLTTGDKGDKLKDGLFFRSSNLHIRLLSSLIILKTLSQADLLAQVFDSVKADLKSDMGRELFLYYQATPAITFYLKPVNKVFMGVAVDILLQMSTDSPFTQRFLDSCSSEQWFRTVAMVLRMPISDGKVVEKLSILLQKLSKIRCNKKFFEVYTIVGIVQEMLRSSGSENAFLALNLKSMLFNLSAGTRSMDY